MAIRIESVTKNLDVLVDFFIILRSNCFITNMSKLKKKEVENEHLTLLITIQNTTEFYPHWIQLNRIEGFNQPQQIMKFIKSIFYTKFMCGMIHFKNLTFKNYWLNIHNQNKGKTTII